MMDNDWYRLHTFVLILPSAKAFVSITKAEMQRGFKLGTPPYVSIVGNPAMFSATLRHCIEAWKHSLASDFRKLLEERVAK